MIDFFPINQEKSVVAPVKANQFNVAILSPCFFHIQLNFLSIGFAEQQQLNTRVFFAQNCKARFVYVIVDQYNAVPGRTNDPGSQFIGIKYLSIKKTPCAGICFPLI